jgi:hypothetical protein
MISAVDRERIESLVYDPSLQPGYDTIKDCLVWEDERSALVSPPGYEFLGKLLVYRGFVIHRGDRFDRIGMTGESYLSAWTYAMDTNLIWPGFKRLSLSPRDVEFLSRSRLMPI